MADLGLVLDTVRLEKKIGRGRGLVVYFGSSFFPPSWLETIAGRHGSVYCKHCLSLYSIASSSIQFRMIQIKSQHNTSQHSMYLTVALKRTIDITLNHTVAHEAAFNKF